MQTQSSTNQHLNRLRDFRQAIYQQGLTRRRDAQFQLLDALLLSGPVKSFPELTLSPAFSRRWCSAYAALEDGQQDTAWLQDYLCQQAPQQGVQVFALDGTAWPRPQAQTLPDRQYLYSPTQAIGDPSIVVGHPYSILAWVAEAGGSWALPVAVQRITSAQDALTVGSDQVKRLCRHRQGATGTVIVADGKYGNQHFLRPLREQPCGVLVRLRQDRVLYRPPPPYGGRGRPRQHGARFAFRESASWGEPAQRLHLTDPKWGQVDLRYWANLHARGAADTPFGVLRIQVHLERAQPPGALWLGWQGPAWSAELLWRCYQQRWVIEPSIRWRKEQLHWRLPRFWDTGACERWSNLVTVAQWLLYLARPLVQDRPLPWQKAQSHLTPGRVRQGFGVLFAQFGTPAAAGKPRGKPPGWPKGRVRKRPARYPVVKKRAKPPATRRKAA